MDKSFFWKINDVWVIFSKCILDTEKRASSERLFLDIPVLTFLSTKTFTHPYNKVRNTYVDIWRLRQHCSSCHPPNTWHSSEHLGQGGNHGYTDRWPGSQQYTGKHGSCRFPVTEVCRMRQLPHNKKKSVAGGILYNCNFLILFTFVLYH